MCCAHVGEGDLGVDVVIPRLENLQCTGPER
uniref:Uncharacterized protein n=1 Tax=Anguilla anguilla TaxID=7936 RepID=A0A0E9TNR0_ANGAN